MVGGNYGLVHVIVFGRSSVIIIKRLRVLQVLGVGEHPPLMVSIIPVKVISGFLLRLLENNQVQERSCEMVVSRSWKVSGLKK